MREPVRHPRNRITYLALTLGIIALGLASRQIPGLFPRALGKYPGDALWTVMVFAGLGTLLPRATSVRLAVFALAVSFAVEFSQLYQAQWINSIRSTRLGHLVLGSGFGWSDLLAYIAGAGIALGAEIIVRNFWSRFTPSDPI